MDFIEQDSELLTKYRSMNESQPVRRRPFSKLKKSSLIVMTGGN